MATVYLSWINDALKRVHVIQGDAGNLVTSTVTSTATGLTATGAFVDSARQTQIDTMIQVTNEVVQDIFSRGLLPKIASTATFTTVAAQREYAMPNDFERVAGKTYDQRAMSGATNGLSLPEYPGGYLQMLTDQPMATQFTGQPSAYAISPAADYVRFDREPDASTASQRYNLLYEKTIQFTATSEADALPFSSVVANRLVPVLAEVWNKAYKGQFDIAEYRAGIATAVGLMTRTQPNDRWGPQRRA